MAASFAQVKTAGFAFGVTSGSVTFDSDVGTDSVVVVAIHGNTSRSITSVVDNKSNSYTTRTGGSSAARHTATADVSTGGSSFQVTVTMDGTNGMRRVQILEYDGADGFDIAVTDTGTSTTPDSGAGTPANDGSVIFGMAASTADPGTVPAGSGFTLRGSQINVQGGWLCTESQIQATAASISTDFSYTNSVFWDCHMLVVPPSVGAAPSPTSHLYGPIVGPLGGPV